MSESFFTNFYRVFNIANEQPLATDGVKVVPWIMWRLWKNRNDLLFNGKELGAQDLVKKALDDAEEWHSRLEVEDERPKTTARTILHPKWTPPPPNWVKCNVDGGGKTLHQMGSVLETEAEALRWVILMVCNLNYSKVIFETDSKSLVDALQDGNLWPCLSMFQQDIKALLSKFQDHHLVFSPRDSNRVAHRIAHETSSFMINVLKLYFIMPCWINSFIENDKKAL
ncbi:uncharacterized protein LOC112082862 [Eutrema salsugineum]|uniref:uncharacterized protein LOC112082862 n=1 Tax=Eutrema salsugineum TaxID=72664 RepID=UPI000CED44C1|nr:uncharacterized protein LOC112082862 [Eutrema salsugineum]